MHSYRSSALHLIVSTLVLAVAMRAWLVMGLIEPVMVSGSSMAPAMRGPHLSIICKECGNPFDVGAEFQSDQIECLGCGFRKNSTQDLPIRCGDRLFIDRTAFQFRNPRRWQPVVFRSPEDGQLTVKRVVALPGEVFELRDGDVWINGKIAARTPAEMRGIRHLIHVETARGLRWHSERDNDWQWRNDTWQISKSDGKWHWLRYRHLNREPINSDSVFNGGLTQRLFPVRDVALSGKVRAAGSGRLSIRFDNGSDQFHWEGSPRDEAWIEVFAFDRHWQILLDDTLVAAGELTAANSKVGATSPFAIGVKNLDLELEDLRIYRDIYYASQNEELGIHEAIAPIRLRSDQVFVIGDNVPVSIDSRRWGPVSLRLLVGQPLGVR